MPHVRLAALNGKAYGTRAVLDPPRQAGFHGKPINGRPEPDALDNAVDVNNTPDIAIQSCDASGNVILWNKATENLTGIPEEDARGKQFEELVTSKTEGVSVFLEHGGYSPYLEHINSVLMAIHDGHDYNKGFSAALAELELLEPFVFEVELNDGSKHKLAGFYTIAEEKLNALDGDSLAKLHANGYLEHIYMVLASISNFRTLIDKKNGRHVHEVIWRFFKRNGRKS